MNLIEAAAHWAWDTSLAASVLIVPALLFSFIFRKPAFTPIRHMLGLLIVARLLLPFSLPSPTSIFNVLDKESGPTLNALPPIISPNVAAEVTRLTSPAREERSLVTSTATIWMIGILLMLGRVAFQHIKVRRWTSAANRITSGPAIEALNAALALSKCRRKVMLYSVPGMPSPALFGLFRPAILLPPDLDPSRLRLVCLHEIAHLKRMDVLTNWLMIIAQSLHWFNPLVWLSLRRLRADQELLCDDDVMRVLHPDERHSYGETLLALASPRSHAFSTLIPVSSNFKQLKERIAMIKQFKPATRRLLMFTLPPLAALLAMLTFTAATEKKDPPTRAVNKGPDARSGSDTKDKEKMLDALTIQLDQQTARVRGMENEVDQLRKSLGVFAVTEGDLLKESASLQQIERDRIIAERAYLENNELLSELKKKDRSELVQGLPAAYRDETLQRLLETREKSEQQLATFKIDYSQEHAEVRRAEAMLKTVDKQIDDRVKGILSGLQSTVSSKKAVVDNLGKQLDELKNKESYMLERARPYFTAKRDLEIHQKMRDSLYGRLLEARSESDARR
jgi:beta-lactamase regulating signal transducer with metallopeptidase domain